MIIYSLNGIIRDINAIIYIIPKSGVSMRFWYTMSFRFTVTHYQLEWTVSKLIWVNLKSYFETFHRLWKPRFKHVHKQQSPQSSSFVTRPKKLDDANLEGHSQLMKESSLLIKSERKPTTLHHWRHFRYWIFHKKGALAEAEILNSFRSRANIYLNILAQSNWCAAITPVSLEWSL